MTEPPYRRQVWLQGQVTFEALERHDCGLVDSPNRVSLVRRTPPTWALLVIGTERTGNFVELVRFCPFCGDNLSPPPPVMVCECSHSDWQHESVDMLANIHGACEEAVCTCKRFVERQIGKERRWRR